MKQRKIYSLLGVSGVAGHETPVAKKWHRVMEWPILGFSVWIPLEWYLSAKGALSNDLRHLSDWIIWSFILFETVLISSLVQDIPRYLRQNWVNLVIIIFGFPGILQYHSGLGALRLLRIMVLVGFIIRQLETFRDLLSRNHLGTTMAVSLVFVCAAGALSSTLDPSIDSLADGIWWAWVTITTVGYGDIVPTSPAGRIFGGVLILMGVALVSMLTANISAFIISRSERDVISGESKILKKLAIIEKRLDSLEEILTQQAANPASHSGRAATDQHALKGEASPKNDSPQD